jgi:aminodeoxyfutalosine deaminase
VNDLSAFISGLPKAELHVHQVGSASPATVAALAARYEGQTTVPSDPDRLADFFTFTDFAHFIEVYLAVVDLIRDAQDVHQLTYDVARGLAEQNVRYAELTVTPFTSVRSGVPAPEFCAAIEDARVQAERDFGILLRWCFDIPGEAGVPAADVTLDIALSLQPAGLTSFGLGGPEIGVPRPQFARHSPPRGRPGCTACRTRANRPARRPSGTRSRRWAPNGSGMASPRPRTHS